jgi:hypothetical protein
LNWTRYEHIILIEDERALAHTTTTHTTTTHTTTTHTTTTHTTTTHRTTHTALTPPKKLVSFYQRHDPVKVPKVPQIMEAFKQEPSRLLRMLKMKYGETVEVASPAVVHRQKAKVPAEKGDATTTAWRQAEEEKEKKRQMQALLLEEEEVIVFGCGVPDNGKGLTDKALLKRRQRQLEEYYKEHDATKIG